MGSFLRGWFLVLFGFLGILFFCGCREREERDLAARLERPMVVVRLFPQYPHVTRESMILDFIPLEEIITREKLTLPSGKEGHPMGHVYTGASGQEYLRMDLVRENFQVPGEIRLRIRLLENGRETVLEDVRYGGEPYRRIWESDRIHLSLTSQARI